MSNEANKKRRGRPYSLPDEQVKALLADPFATYQTWWDVRDTLIQAARERGINTLCSISEWADIRAAWKAYFVTKST